MRILSSTLFDNGIDNAFHIPNFLSFLTGNEIETEDFIKSAVSRIDEKIITVFLIGFFASLANSLLLVKQETGNFFDFSKNNPSCYILLLTRISGALRAPSF